MTIKYTESGLWIEELSDSYRVGLSEKGQDDIGEVMFLELPEFGKELKKGDNLLSVEGAKAVTELTLPMAGQVKEIHKKLEDHPDLINSEDRADNWILELTDVHELDENDLSDDVWFEN